MIAPRYVVMPLALCVALLVAVRWFNDAIRKKFGP